MTNASCQFGLLLVVFGGFVSLNRTQFGGLSDFVGSLGMVVLFLGAVIGVLGLVPSNASQSNRSKSNTSR